MWELYKMEKKIKLKIKFESRNEYLYSVVLENITDNNYKFILQNILEQANSNNYNRSLIDIRKVPIFTNIMNTEDTLKFLNLKGSFLI